MTVIVAARTTHKVGKKKKRQTVEAITIASDTQLTDGWEKSTGAYPKIWQVDARLLFGACGFVGSWQAVKYGATWPHYPETQDWEEWLVTQLRPVMTESLDYAEVMHRKKGVIDTGMGLIVATGINLASIDSIGGVVVPRRNCVAIGSGYAQALGSLGDGDGPWTSQDVVNAAFAATLSAQGCGAPIHWATTLDYEIYEAELS